MKEDAGPRFFISIEKGEAIAWLFFVLFCFVLLSSC